MIDSQEADINRYDRQIHAIGFVPLYLLFCFFYLACSLEAMKKLARSSVLISGMNGVGVEIGMLSLFNT